MWSSIKFLIIAPLQPYLGYENHRDSHLFVVVYKMRIRRVHLSHLPPSPMGASVYIKELIPHGLLVKTMYFVINNMVGFYFSFHNGTLLMDIGNVLKEIYVNGEGGDTVVCEGFCGCK